MTYRLILVLYAAASVSCAGSVKALRKEYLPEDGMLNFTELCDKYRRAVEEHQVVTEDGYILTVFHVFPSKESSKTRPVLLIHGILDSSDSFIIRGNKSLVATLTENGYDVWAGNARGNKYSRRHQKLDPDKDRSFWDFSFHESGYYDIPAFIDYVLNKTGAQTLKAIAHSQGTTEFFVLGSMRPEYHKKVSVVVALAPVAFLSHLEPPVNYLVKSAGILDVALQILGEEEVLADHVFYKYLIEIFCTLTPFRYEVCVNGVIFALGGFDQNQLERDFLPVVIGHIPCGTSRKSLVHLSQNAIQKRFAQFDYGEKTNLIRYKSPVPPEYDLSKNNLSIALFFTSNDGYSKIKDIKKLKSLLPNVVLSHRMQPSNWNHFDFVWGRLMYKYLYPPLLEVLRNYD